MATDYSGRQTTPIGGAGSPISCRPSGLRVEPGTESWTVRSLHRAPRGGGERAEWTKMEKMEENSGRIGESYVGIAKKTKVKFLIEKIC